MRRLLVLATALLLSLPAVSATVSATVKVAEIHGAISSASAAYFLRALDEAQKAKADLLVLKLDTPGGQSEAYDFYIAGVFQRKIEAGEVVAFGKVPAFNLAWEARESSWFINQDIRQGSADGITVQIGGDRVLGY